MGKDMCVICRGKCTLPNKQRNLLINYICLKLKGIVSYSKLCIKKYIDKERFAKRKEREGKEIEKSGMAKKA
jgi:hypothetical protein